MNDKQKPEVTICGSSKFKGFVESSFPLDDSRFSFREQEPSPYQSAGDIGMALFGAVIVIFLKPLVNTLGEEFKDIVVRSVISLREKIMSDKENVAVKMSSTEAWFPPPISLIKSIDHVIVLSRSMSKSDVKAVVEAFIDDKECDILISFDEENKRYSHEEMRKLIDSMKKGK